jgi:alkylhydroperoxidase family enzyme
VTEPTRYSTPPVELPIEPWLLDCSPVNGCGVCMALVRERRSALSGGDQRKAYEVSAEIRNHPHGSRA